MHSEPGARMTIHIDFFKIMKEGCEHAFTDAPQVRPDVVFINGQVKLMGPGKP